MCGRMASFTFKAVGADGALLHGSLEATDRDGAVAQLQSRGALPLRVQAAEALPRWAALLRLQDTAYRLPHGARVDLLQRLATLLGSGVPIEDALDILASGQGAKPVRQLVGDLLRQIREGADLADAMAQYGSSFPPIVIGMVRAGETSGALAETLARLADYLLRAETSRQAVRSALIYPAILLVTAGFSMLIVLLVVLPALKPAIIESGGALPLPTQLAFLASDTLLNFWWLLLGVIIVAALLIRHVITDRALRMRRDALLLRLPLVGATIRLAEAGRFTRTLGVLVDGAVSLPVALALAQPVLSNAVLAEAMAQVTLRLREGEGLAEPLARAGCFPELAIQLVRIGEATGKLAAMLIQSADIFDATVRRSIDRAMAVMVPLLTIGLGAMVAGIVASVVMALLSVNDFIK